MRKILTVIITLLLITASTTMAKTYYFKALSGVVDSPDTNTVFSQVEEPVSWDVSLSFNNSYLYITPGDSASTPYSISGDNADSAVLSVTSDNESFLSASVISIDSANNLISIPSSATAINGSADITLIAKDTSGNTISSDSIHVNITPLSANNRLTKWTVSAGQNVHFPFSDTYFNRNYSGHLDWGDGSEIESFAGVTIQSLSHTYTNAGTYDIRIDGGFFEEDNFYGMFQGQTIPSGFDISNWDTSNVTTFEIMFSLSTIPSGFNINSWDTSNVTNLHATFATTVLPSGFNINNWNVSNVTTLEGLFFSTTIPSGLDISNWDTSKVTTLRSIFHAGTIPYGFDISRWNTSNVKVTRSAFDSTRIPSNFDISGWDLSNVTDSSYMYLSTITY